MTPDRSAAFAAEVHPLLTELIGPITNVSESNITLTLLGYAAARWPDLTVEEFYRSVQLMAEIAKMDDRQG